MGTMKGRFYRIFIIVYFFGFAFFLPSQLGKHFFFSFSYLSGIRIDYLAPTIYLSDILSLPLIFLIVWRIARTIKIVRSALSFKLFLPLEARLDPRSSKNEVGRAKWGTLSFWLIFLLIGINYFFALSKPLWIYGVIKLLQVICLFLFFKRYGKNKLIFGSILWGLCLGSFAELGLALLQLSARHSIQGLWWYLGERNFSIFTPGIAKAYIFGKDFLRPYGSFSHPNSMAGFYLLIYSYILTQKRITNFFLKTSLLVFSSLLIVVSFSRMALITYIIINTLYVFKSSFTCRLCSVAKIGVALFLCLLVVNTSGDMNSFQKREDFFQKSIAIINQKPLSGTGIGGYLIAQHNYPQKFSTFFEQPVHNIFLLAIAQLGIPLSVLLFALIIRIIRAKSKYIWFLFPLLSVTLTGIGDHYWITLQQNVLVLSLLLFFIFFS